MKDGLLDKLQDQMNDMEREGFLCATVGVEIAALDEMHCDFCRLGAIQQLAMQVSYDLIGKYRKKYSKDVKHH